MFVIIHSSDTVAGLQLKAYTELAASSALMNDILFTQSVYKESAQFTFLFFIDITDSDDAHAEIHTLNLHALSLQHHMCRNLITVTNL